MLYAFVAEPRSPSASLNAHPQDCYRSPSPQNRAACKFDKSLHARRLRISPSAPEVLPPSTELSWPLFDKLPCGHWSGSCPGTQREDCRRRITLRKRHSEPLQANCRVASFQFLYFLPNKADCSSRGTTMRSLRMKTPNKSQFSSNSPGEHAFVDDHLYPYSLLLSCTGLVTHVQCEPSPDDLSPTALLIAPFADKIVRRRVVSSTQIVAVSASKLRPLSEELGKYGDTFSG